MKCIQELIDQGTELDISAGFIYLNRVPTDFSYMLNAGGMIIREALAHLLKDGAVTNQDFEWVGNWQSLPRETQVAIAERRWDKMPADIWEKASVNKIREYAKLLTDDEIKAALAQEQCGVAFNIPITSKFTGGYNEQIDAEWAKANNRGYNFVLAVGWTRHNGIDYWVVPNTWDKTWGDNVYCYLPFGNPIVEAYVAFDDESYPKYWRIQCGRFTEEQRQHLNVLQTKLKAWGYNTYVSKREEDGEMIYRVQIGAFRYKDNATKLEKRILDNPRIKMMDLEIIKVYY